MRTGSQRDLTKLIVGFRYLTNVPNSLLLGFMYQEFVVPYLVRKFRDIMKSKIYWHLTFTAMFTEGHHTIHPSNLFFF